MRRVAGLLATGLGAFLITLALLLRFWVPGYVIKFPLNEYTVLTLRGADITYFNSADLKEYSGVHAISTRTIEGDVKSGTPSIAVWNSFTALEDTSNQYTINDTNQVTAFNRRTGNLLNCCGAALDGKSTVRQSGLGYMFPFATQHRTYQVFDVTLKRPVAFRYAGTSTVDGMAADKFVEHVVNLRFGQEQTLPGQLVGLKQQATVTLPEYLTATNTIWVDPVTGSPVDMIIDQQEALEDPPGTTRLVLLAGRLAQTPSSVRAAVASAAKSHNMIKWIEDSGPLIGLVAGIVLLAGGITLIWRSQSTWVPAYDDDEFTDLGGQSGR